ncbi:MAG: hypothetical protein ACI9GH_000598 [Candidatus Paceibacteria bacterium]|jgi:hypothetical protein
MKKNTAALLLLIGAGIILAISGNNAVPEIDNVLMFKEYSNMNQLSTWFFRAMSAMLVLASLLIFFSPKSRI